MANTKSTLSLALGSVFVASMAVSSVAGAAQNPFEMASLDKGYMVAQADKAKEGKCGEGKCGSMKVKEAACGAAKAKEAACGAAKAKEAKCGGDKAKEGKCGGAK